MPSNRNFLLQESSGWVDVYRVNDEIFVAIALILFSEFADSEVEALIYGINSQPDKLIRLENFRDYQDQIFSTSDNNIEYVTSRLIFTDKTKSDIRKSELKP